MRFHQGMDRRNLDVVRAASLILSVRVRNKLDLSNIKIREN